MPQGLQVFDASGNVIVDTSTFVLKEIAIATVNSGTTGSVALPTVGATVLGISPEAEDIDGLETGYNSSNNTLEYRGNGANANHSVRVLAL